MFGLGFVDLGLDFGLGFDFDFSFGFGFDFRFWSNKSILAVFMFETVTFVCRLLVDL